jgi:uncharacterized repeat protein (TIGR03803 family)
MGRIGVLMIFAAAHLPAATLTTLFSFSCTDQGIPHAGVTIGDGPVLYGTTANGDANQGTVYALTPSPSGGWTETTIHSFQDVDGAYPAAGVVIGAGGVLYGTTRNGGGDQSRGTVFSLSPPESPGGAWTERVLHSFSGPDGAYPESMLAIGPGIGGAMALYGTTTYGGSRNSGTIFSFSPPASPGGEWQESVLFSFTKSGHQGYSPYTGVVIGPTGPDGQPVLFGTAGWGGGGSGAVGSVYALAPPASAGDPWVYTVLYRFSPNGGGYTPGPLTLGSGADGQLTLYGTTASGAPTGSGSVYALTPAGLGVPWIESELFEFLDATFHSDGAAPAGGVAIGGGVWYGTTSQGGPTDNGTVFSLTPPAAGGGPWTESVLYSFTGGGDGSAPEAPISIGQGGALYSTTTYAGVATTCGTVFSLTP